MILDLGKIGLGCKGTTKFIKFVKLQVYKVYQVCQVHQVKSMKEFICFFKKEVVNLRLGDGTVPKIAPKKIIYYFFSTMNAE